MEQEYTEFLFFNFRKNLKRVYNKKIWGIICLCSLICASFSQGRLSLAFYLLQETGRGKQSNK